MVNLDLTEDDILVERDVIIEERNQRTETNQARFTENRQTQPCSKIIVTVCPSLGGVMKCQT